MSHTQMETLLRYTERAMRKVGEVLIACEAAEMIPHETVIRAGQQLANLRNNLKGKLATS